MTNKHPIIRIFNVLKKDNQLIDLLNDVRGQDSPQPLIFTLDIPEDYKKTEQAPFIRITEVFNGDTLEHDGISDHYRYLFAVEVFSASISNIQSICNQIEAIIQSNYGKCTDRELNRDEKFNLYIQMLNFNIILNKKE